MLTFNVENLFDVDGVALFDDYSMDIPEDEGIPYSANLLGKKLAFVRDTVLSVEDDEGPDVILFQELERDRTPRSGMGDPAKFLRDFRQDSVQDMLENSGERRIKGLPSYAFLLKALDEAGLDYPYVSIGQSEGDLRDQAAHVNVVFSRFPITATLAIPTLMAREVQVVTLDVDGHPFIVINNHWKSGASNPETESIRIENAKTVRRVLDEILAENPKADVLIAGDLNSYYDQSLLFPEMRTTAMNSILGSQGDEQAVADGDEELYNLWFELPQEERYSETWRDRKGTLMNMILTPGFYDDRGIQYVDNSFEVVQIPGLNMDEWGRPMRFQFAGGGRGGSDHFPVLARFKTVDGDGSRTLALKDPGSESDQPGEILYVDYDLDRPGILKPLPAKTLFEMPEDQWADQIGSLFSVSAKLVSRNPVKVEAGGHVMEVYCPSKETWLSFYRAVDGHSIRFVGELGVWKGNYQWVIRNPSWVE